MKQAFIFSVLLGLALGTSARADDWPQWMGPRRDGIWRERGIVERLPTDGLTVFWRAGICPSYSGPAVAGNRLLVMDRPPASSSGGAFGAEAATTNPAAERVLCLDAATCGKQGFFANAFMTEHEDRTFLWNDQGELILARLKPEGFEEISRAKVLDPLEKTRGRIVTWCHPAYANRRAYVHNGKMLVCISLAEKP